MTEIGSLKVITSVSLVKSRLKPSISGEVVSGVRDKLRECKLFGGSPTALGCSSRAAGGCDDTSCTLMLLRSAIDRERFA